MHFLVDRVENKTRLQSFPGQVKEIRAQQNGLISFKGGETNKIAPCGLFVTSQQQLPKSLNSIEMDEMLSLLSFGD